MALSIEDPHPDDQSVSYRHESGGEGGQGTIITLKRKNGSCGGLPMSTALICQYQTRLEVLTGRTWERLNIPMVGCQDCSGNRHR
jgi:hypothetical protein